MRWYRVPIFSKLCLGGMQRNCRLSTVVVTRQREGRKEGERAGGWVGWWVGGWGGKLFGNGVETRDETERDRGTQSKRPCEPLALGALHSETP